MAGRMNFNSHPPKVKVYVIYGLTGRARVVCTDLNVAKKLHAMAGNSQPLEELTLDYIDQGFKDLAKAIGATL